jgi:protein gp37
MNRTGIEWCDWTWNPIVGCSPVSDGCAHCYAAAISRRFHLPWGTAHFLPERLGEPAQLRKPGRVFVCSMSDLGHDAVKPEWRSAIIEAMLAAPWHTYIVLTKRPGPWLRLLPSACWAGVTIESDAPNVTSRYFTLRYWAWPRAAVTFISVEPMLSPLSLSRWSYPPQWVICGPETGTGARPCDPQWIEALAYESPCFFDKRKTGWTRREWPQGKGGE